VGPLARMILLRMKSIERELNANARKIDPLARI
jgi:hypothetical protein